MFVLVRRSVLPWRTRGLLYQWSAGAETGRWTSSPYAGGVRVLTLRNGPPDEAWVTERRDLAADLAAAFGRLPDRIEAIGVLADADDTGGVAAADFGELTLQWPVVSPPAAPPRP